MVQAKCALQMGDAFQAFFDFAKASLGPWNLDEESLTEVWLGADRDLNRAMNHLIGAPHAAVQPAPQAVVLLVEDSMQ